MPDMTMCLNNECPRREDCFRFIAKPEPVLQSYGAFRNDEYCFVKATPYEKKQWEERNGQ